MNTGSIESLGVLLKEETLQTVENHILENTLVLESIEPYPGYHGENMPTARNPESLFLITEKPWPDDVIFRVSQHLCCLPELAVGATPVEISLMNHNLNGIRLRGLSDYSVISEIQQCYVDKQIRFMKFRHINSPALMKIIKIFHLDVLEDNIYVDREDENTYYLSIPYHFKWEKFRNVTAIVKSNLDNSNFDCASGFIYLKNMMEFVRIYVHNPSPGRLRNIREKYLDEIARIRDDSM